VGDAPLLNAIKEQSQTLKQIDRNLAKIAKALEALNTSYVEANRRDEVKIEGPPLNTPRLFGWNTAAAHQIDGTLRVGDMKNEQDDSIWVWSGEIWERVDTPPMMEKTNGG